MASWHQRNKHWREGLLVELSSPQNWLLSNRDVVVVPDQYPKAMYHFLVLPRADIPSIFQLTRKDLKLLDKMYVMALNVIDLNNRNSHEFKIGYHAEPSLLQLHMHVISTDFHSPTLKTARHWNSFNSELFIPHEELMLRIVQEGRITKMNHRLVYELRQLPLQCHRCPARPRTMAGLKAHLMTHLKWL